MGVRDAGSEKKKSAERGEGEEDGEEDGEGEEDDGQRGRACRTGLLARSGPSTAATQAAMDGSTLYFDDAVPPHCSVGVDLFFFCSEPGRELRGVRNLPAGVHVVHLTSGLHNTRTAQLLELDGRSGYAVRFCHRTGDDAPYTEIHTVRLDRHSVVPDTLGRRVVDYGALAVAGADWRALRFDRSVLGFVRSPDGVLRTHDSTGPELRRRRRRRLAPARARARAAAERARLHHQRQAAAGASGPDGAGPHRGLP